jgi:hypothetical protein
MILLTDIIIDISNAIKKHEGELNYDKWHVAFSWKENNQFNYDTKVTMKNVTEIGTLDNIDLDELKDSLETMGIDCVVEDDSEPHYIYLYKTLI